MSLHHASLCLKTLHFSLSLLAFCFLAPLHVHVCHASVACPSAFSHLIIIIHHYLSRPITTRLSYYYNFLGMAAGTFLPPAPPLHTHLLHTPYHPLHCLPHPDLTTLPFLLYLIMSDDERKCRIQNFWEGNRQCLLGSPFQRRKQAAGFSLCNNNRV